MSGKTRAELMKEIEQYKKYEDDMEKALVAAKAEKESPKAENSKWRAESANWSEKCLILEAELSRERDYIKQLRNQIGALYNAIHHLSRSNFSYDDPVNKGYNRGAGR